VERPNSNDTAKMADFVDGTCKSVVEACEALGLDEGFDWDDALLDLNVERCSYCDWWYDSCMLTEVPQKNGFFCDQCLAEFGIEKD
jgi:hypothetical protein